MCIIYATQNAPCDYLYSNCLLLIQCAFHLNNVLIDLYSAPVLYKDVKGPWSTFGSTLNMES